MISKDLLKRSPVSLHMISHLISEEISEDIPEDLLDYPKMFSEVLQINGYPRGSSEIVGYPRISLWGELPDDGETATRPRDLPGAGRRISPMLGTRSQALHARVLRARAGYLFIIDAKMFLDDKQQCTRLVVGIRTI